MSKNKFMIVTFLAFAFLAAQGTMTVDYNTEYFSQVPLCVEIDTFHEELIQASA